MDILKNDIINYKYRCHADYEECRPIREHLVDKVTRPLIAAVERQLAFVARQYPHAPALVLIFPNSEETNEFIRGIGKVVRDGWEVRIIDSTAAAAPVMGHDVVAAFFMEDGSLAVTREGCEDITIEYERWPKWGVK